MYSLGEQKQSYKLEGQRVCELGYQRQRPGAKCKKARTQENGCRNMCMGVSTEFQILENNMSREVNSHRV